MNGARIVRVGPNAEWPAGICDGLSLSCSICGEWTPYDYAVWDCSWGAVVPREHRLGVVCLRCYDRLAAEKGEPLYEDLRFVQFTGTGFTLLLRPETAYVYGDCRAGDPRRHTGGEGGAP